MDEELARYLNQLRSPRQEAREEAMAALGVMGARALSHLLALLAQHNASSRDKETTLAALLSIVVHERKAGPFVDDQGDITPLRPQIHSMAGALAVHLKDGAPEVRRSVVQILGLLEDWRSVEGLIRLLKSPFSGFRTLALESLRRITRKDFIEPDDWEKWWDEVK
jgi:HEAT repeat protein